MVESKTATTYPTEEQYERWKDEADEFGMSTSEFIKSMTEAGLKKFERHVETDEEAQELRRQRNDLKGQLEQSRSRVRELEDQLHSGERKVLEQKIEENPGISFPELVQEVVDTVPERVNRHLTELEGDSIQSEEEGFYPLENSR